MAQGLEELSREQLVKLLEITAKDLIALDGTWFQSLERAQGMDTAMEHDRGAWRRFVPSEARRLKQLLELPDGCGLAGLAKALPFRCTSLANEWELIWDDDGRALTFRITNCRVQNARSRKGMEFHPCKSVGELEYAGFATALDDRIQCECLSCFPDITDSTCNCAWRFWLADEGARRAV
ncbi:DUF6125 family protein [Adlercreutzia sp. R21]|uniref:DUF6125 family protein n=1 Tax=Adlercreutzia wanghongyangiae TaxID=3111451 RepID=UPI002DBA79C0|nr:DUF6125 family protein [Adlercreutzia sp. R21]MEC4183923.1 DUF6125 family protein [Adlercreutzia sp. R21]